MKNKSAEKIKLTSYTVFRDQNYENENGNRYDLYIPAGLDRMQDQNLILYIHGGSFNSGSKADGETWCRYYAAQGYITASVDYTLQMHGKDASIYQMNKEIENAVRAIRQRTEELGYHIAGMAPFGVSAGGTLAMNLAYSGNSAIPVRFVFQVAAPTYFEPSEWPLLMKVDKLTSRLLQDDDRKGIGGLYTGDSENLSGRHREG